MAQRAAFEVAKSAGDRLEGRLKRDELANFIRASESAKGIRAMLALMQSMRGISKLSNQLDADDYALNVAMARFAWATAQS